MFFSILFAKGVLNGEFHAELKAIKMPKMAFNCALIAFCFMIAWPAFALYFMLKWVLEYIK